MTAKINQRPHRDPRGAAVQFRHWLKLSVGAAIVAGGLRQATVADLFMPIFSGNLVDAMTYGASDPAARRAAFTAFGGIVALGLISMILRLVGLQAIVPFTLRIMSDVSRDAFMRVQRFSTDWHANSFAGSTVRKITRGMWALDLLNDTILMALMPSLLVLLGSMILLGLHWPSLGLVIAVGAAIYVPMIVLFSTRYIAPAARVSNAWDTKVGGTLADALTCNAVVKSFGAETREDARLARVISRWRRRVRRTWLRYNYTAMAQFSVLLCLRAAVIGGAVLLWIAGRASPGDVTYVLTSYYIIHAYLRDVGMHINNLQRSVNDMEELVAIHDEAIGIADAPGALPMRVHGGRIVFEDVTFHYGGHRTPLYDGLSVDIRAGERVGLAGRSGSGKTTFVLLGAKRLYDVSGGRILIDGQDIAPGHAAFAAQPDLVIVQQELIPVPLVIGREHRLWLPGATHGGGGAGGTVYNAHEFIPCGCRRATARWSANAAASSCRAASGSAWRWRARSWPTRAGLDPRRGDLQPRSESLEALIQQAMERLMKGRTSIVIVHRLSTVRSPDRILVFRPVARSSSEGTHASPTAVLRAESIADCSSAVRWNSIASRRRVRPGDVIPPSLFSIHATRWRCS